MSEQPNGLPSSKAELLERIQRARSALEQTLEHLTTDQMTRPGPEEWSVKDHLAHLVSWEQILIRGHLQGRSIAEALGIDETIAQMPPEGGLNDYFRARDKDLPLNEVLDRYRRSHQQLLDALAEVDDAKLQTPYGERGRPLMAFVAGDSYEHYEEHDEFIRAIIGSSQ
jgi:uncharacterized protein (TIGR03083 family)